jgi:hypothetical protein
MGLTNDSKITWIEIRRPLQRNPRTRQSVRSASRLGHDRVIAPRHLR